MQIDFVSSAIDAVGGILIGFLIGLIIQMTLRWRENIRLKMNLKRALLAELKASEAVLDYAPLETVDVDSVLEEVPRTIFDANADKIGGLSNNELMSITLFYSVMK